MILRRLSQSFKEQNWMAIAIEFVLLVLGVFLGIQVANWNQKLADARLGQEYVMRLKSDLEKDLASRRDLIAYYAAVLESIERTDALLADPVSDAKTLVFNAYRATEINFRAPTRATWDEIVSTGDTGLLPRDVVVSAGEYFAFDTARNHLDILNVSAYRHRVRTIIPLSMQQALRAGCSDLRDGTQQITGFMTDCSIDMSPQVIEATAADLRADPVVLAELRHQYSDVYSAHANISGDAEVIRKALSSLANAGENREAR